MKCFRLFPILLASATGQDKPIDTYSRIAGGTEVDVEGQFSSAANLLIRLRSGISYFCGGTLIAPTVVLTAAHCIDAENIEFITVEFGKLSSDDLTSEMVVVESFDLHAGYDKSNFENDIAILRLTEPASAVPALLPFGGDPTPVVDQAIDVVGYGFLDPGSPSDKLMHINIEVRETADCDIYNFGIDDDVQFCAGAVGEVPCLGDSGGPAMVKNDSGEDTVVGIVSYGAGDCYWHPVAFTRVEAYEDFITEMSCDGFNNPTWCPRAETLEIGVMLVACFAGSNLVQVADRGSIRMRDLQLGDEVHVGNGAYEPVYSFGHLAPTMDAAFLQVTTERSKVTLTAEHMVFTESRGAIPASLLQEGEYLLSTSGVDRVKSIRIVQERGVYAPFTPSGKIVVNDILASSYVALEDNEGIPLFGGWLTLSHQWLAHSMQLPHRLACYHFGSCPTEEYSPEGISLWVYEPLKASQWLLNLSGAQKCLLLSTVFLVATLLTIVEAIVLHPSCLLAMLILALAARYRVAWKKV